MQISKVDTYQPKRVTFRSLLLGDSVKAMQKSFNRPANFRPNTSAIQEALRKVKLHKKENVDLVIHFTEEEGYYAFISSKKSGIPNSPDNKRILSKDAEIVAQIEEWVNRWDSFFAKNK